MHTSTTSLAVVLLAGQIATAAYIPVRRGQVITNANDADYTSTHFSYQPESTPVSFTYDPKSFTYDPEYSFSYDPAVTKYSYDPSVTHYTYAPKFTYDPTMLAPSPPHPHKKRVDVGPINPINGLPIPTDLPKLTESIGSVNPINGLPVASASVDRSKPEPPNPTAIPSAFALQPGVTIQPLTQSVVSGHTTLVPISSSKRRISTTLSTKTKTKTVTSFDYLWTHSAQPTPSSSVRHYTKTVTVTVTPSSSSSHKSSSSSSHSVTILTATSSPSPTPSSQTATPASSSSSKPAAGMIGSSKGYEFPYPGVTEPTSTAKPKKECVYPIPGAECP